MKKVIFATLLAVSAILTLGVVSCTKKGYCECSTITDIPQNSLSDQAYYAACVAADAVDRLAKGSGCNIK